MSATYSSKLFIKALNDIFTKQTTVTKEYIETILKPNIIAELTNRVDPTTGIYTGNTIDEITVDTIIISDKKGYNMDKIILGHYYDINTVAPEYLNTDFKRIKCIGISVVDNIKKIDILQRYNTIRQTHQDITDINNEIFITFLIDGKEVIFGKSWIAYSKLVHKTGKTTFTTTDLAPDDLAYIAGIIHNMGKDVAISTT